MRRISSALHSAARFTSGACSGRALMLGMARYAFNSSTYRSRFVLMKSITLVMSAHEVLRVLRVLRVLKVLVLKVLKVLRVLKVRGAESATFSGHSFARTHFALQIRLEAIGTISATGRVCRSPTPS